MRTGHGQLEDGQECVHVQVNQFSRLTPIGFANCCQNGLGPYHLYRMTL